MVDLARDWPAIAQQPAHSPDSATTPDNLAYVIYTSGSTGTPKGVAIAHSSAAALIDWARTIFPAAHASGVLASTSICFDLSVFELFGPLCQGSTVVLVENALRLAEIPDGIVTLVNTVPSAMAEILRLEGLPSSVRTVNLAGEPLPRQLVQQLYQHDTVEQVFNLYGPSEDTTYSTFALVARDSAGTPPIGRPITNTRAYLLDAQMQPVPIGVPGELYLGGEGLARGYLNRPELTAERFVPNPFTTTDDRRPTTRDERAATDGGRWSVVGGRLYRTGDLARWLPSGELEYLGRLDEQVKLRGYRIEPGEIAAVLRAHPAVHECVVVTREDMPSDVRLVAYVVTSDEVSVTSSEASPLVADNSLRATHNLSLVTHNSSLAAELRTFLAARLPAYMIPVAFVLLDALPHTPNGKIDRRALPIPEPAEPSQSAAFVAPRTPIEEALASVWAEMLHRERIGVHDHFFALGGHSLLAIQMIARLRTRFQIDLPIQRFFEAPTIAEVARSIEMTRWAASSSYEMHEVVGDDREEGRL